MSSCQGRNGGAAGYPRLNVGHTSPIQLPSDYYTIREQAPPFRRTLLSYPETAPHYDAQRVAYTPKPNYGLPTQGLAYTEPALQRPAPLLSSHFLPRQVTNNFEGNHAAYPPLRSGVSAYMPQQGSAESSTVRPTQNQPGIEIANGGVDLRQSLPSMENVIKNRDISVQFPDGTTKVVRTHGDVVTLRMAAKAVQKWYAQNSGRSGSWLKGFRVANGVYVAQIA